MPPGCVVRLCATHTSRQLRLRLDSRQTTTAVADGAHSSGRASCSGQVNKKKRKGWPPCVVALDGAGARVRRHERGGGYVRSGRLWGAPILPLLSNTAPAWAARVLASSENIAHGCTSHVSFWGVNTGRYLPPCPARRKAANALRRPRKLLAVRGSAALPVWPAPPPAPGRATPPPPPPAGTAVLWDHGAARGPCRQSEAAARAPVQTASTHTRWYGRGTRRARRCRDRVPAAGIRQPRVLAFPEAGGHEARSRLWRTGAGRHPPPEARTKPCVPQLRPS